MATVGKHNQCRPAGQSINQLLDYPIIQLPDSEQSDGNHRSLVHHVLIGRDFDVAVSLREAGDVAGAFERRKGCATFQPHRVELMPSGARRNPPAERDVDGAWRVRRKPRRGPQERHKQDVCVREARRRVAGHPEKRRPVNQGERGWLARLHGDAVKDHLAARGHQIHDQIARADRASA